MINWMPLGANRRRRYDLCLFIYLYFKGEETEIKQMIALLSQDGTSLLSARAVS
jgi:hypothetical protein